MSLRKRIQELAVEQDVVQEVESVEVNEDAPSELQETISNTDNEIAIQEEADLVASNIEEVQGGIQATLDSGEEVSDVDVAVAEAHLQQIAIRAGFANSLVCENITYYNFNTKCEETLSLESYNYANNNREKLENINLALEGIWSSIKKAGSDTLTWIKNLLKKFWNWVTGWFKPKGDKVVKEIKEAETEANKNPEAKEVKEDIVEIMKKATDWSDVEKTIEVTKKQMDQSSRVLEASKHLKAMYKYLERPFIISKAVEVYKKDQNFDEMLRDVKIGIASINKAELLTKIDEFMQISASTSLTNVLTNVPNNTGFNISQYINQDIADNIYKIANNDEMKNLISMHFFKVSTKFLRNDLSKILENVILHNHKVTALLKQNIEKFIKYYEGKINDKNTPEEEKEIPKKILNAYLKISANQLKLLNIYYSDILKASMSYKHYLDTLAGKYDAKEQKKFDDFMMSDEPLKL